MKVTVHLTSGSVTIHKMPDATAADLVEDWNEGDHQTLTITLGEHNAITHIARRHIVRIDLDVEPDNEPTPDDRKAGK